MLSFKDVKDINLINIALEMLTWSQKSPLINDHNFLKKKYAYLSLEIPECKAKFLKHDEKIVLFLLI